MPLDLHHTELLREQNFIDQQWQAAKSGRLFSVSNPATGAVFAQVPDSGADDARAAVAAAHAAFPAWRAKSARERAQLLKRWHALIIARQEDLGRLISREQGKPLHEGRGEVLYAASYVEWFAEEATRTYGDLIPEPVRGRKLMVVKEPVGVVAAITPWNFPAAMIARKIAPALVKEKFVGALRVGGTAELAGYSLKLRAARRATLDHVVTDLFPRGGDLSQATFWAGLRPMTPDGTPVIGPTPFNNLWLSTGHGTLGWTMAAGTGALLSDWIAGRKPAIDTEGLALSRYIRA